MNNFYEKLIIVRNEMCHSNEYPYIKTILDQLLITAFNNQEQFDTLPKTFYLKNIHYSTNLDAFFSKLGLSIELHKVYVDWTSKTANFQVTIIET